MDEAFIIMQIGSPEMDKICDEVIVPAIESAGLIPKRVDRDNEGGLLKAEIVDFLERSTIIVADLTNERPNCYLEVGYAMGLGKKRNLLLTVREDHHHRSKNYKHSGPRVHFDLEGYDLLLWEPDKLDKFRTELEKRIKRRLAILAPAPADEPTKEPKPRGAVPDDEWVTTQRELAEAAVHRISRFAFMDASVAISPKGSWRQASLLSAVEDSQISTFGWPIGVVLQRDDARPRPTAEGVRAEVSIKRSDDQASYDFWYLRQTGDFYMLQSLFEDERLKDSIFVDTRIVRTTELLLFLSRLYTRLEVTDSTAVHIEVRYSGLRGRELRVASPNRLMGHDRKTTEDSVTSVVECTVGELQTKLEALVRELLSPLFMLFEFFEVPDQVWTEIVDAFVDGRVA